MYSRFPKRSVNAKDILLLFLGWIISKVLDFMWEGISVRVGKLKPKPLRIESVGFWFLRVACIILGFECVRNTRELKRLVRNLKRGKVDAKTILLLGTNETHPLHGLNLLRTIIQFGLFYSTQGFLVLDLHHEPLPLPNGVEVRQG